MYVRNFRTIYMGEPHQFARLCMSSLRVLSVLIVISTLAVSGCAAESPSPSPEQGEPLSQNLTEVEEQLVGSYLDNAWRNVLTAHPDAVRPQVERVRLIDQADWTTVIPDCLAELGHHVVPDAHGSWSVKGGPGSEPYFIAFYTCEAMYPVHPKFNASLSDAQLTRLYDYFVTSLKPCLEAEGYEVPPAPSLQTFLETYHQDGGWFLHEGVADAGVGPDESARLNRVCPPVPDNFIGG
jgi:hypothetical protein